MNISDSELFEMIRDRIPGAVYPCEDKECLVCKKNKELVEELERRLIK